MRDSKGRFIKGHAQLNTGKSHFKKSHSPWNKNKLGVQIAWNKGIPWNEETRNKIKISRTGKAKGDKNTRWKGGKKITQSGYIMILSPQHPFCDNQGYVREHRLVMEKNIGRYLKKEETVHHINRIKCDNKIKNLMLFSSNSEHIKFHKKIKNK